MEIKENAYCGYKELEDMDYLPVEDNIQEIFEHLSLIDKELYLIRYDTDTGYCTLYKVKKAKEIKI